MSDDQYGEDALKDTDDVTSGDEPGPQCTPRRSPKTRATSVTAKAADRSPARVFLGSACCRGMVRSAAPTRGGWLQAPAAAAVAESPASQQQDHDDDQKNRKHGQLLDLVWDMP
jgi:hypothetical protein